MGWLKCPNGCIFEADIARWKESRKRDAIIEPSRMTCSKCHRDFSPGAFTESAGGAATKTVAMAGALSMVQNPAARSDALVKARILKLLPKLAFLESTRRKKVDE